MSSRQQHTASIANSYASVLRGQAHATENGYRPPQVGSFGIHHEERITVPSYLSESLYAERLASQASSAFNVGPSFSASPWRVSHRGLAFDVVERTPSNDDHALNPLPTRWNDSDKAPAIELAGSGAEARYMGPAKSNDVDAAAVRADKPMPLQCGLFYFEITIISRGKEGSISIGFCTAKSSLTRLPGWEPESWGYHGDDGNSFCCQGVRKAYGPKFSTNDVIGCGVNFRTKEAFFTRNGVNLGVAFRDINKSKLYPVVGLKKPGEHVRVNFGQDEFIYDIDHYMKVEKAKTLEVINNHPTASLCPPLDETALIQALVSQYLAHDGYVDTARSFAQEVEAERTALRANAGPSSVALDPKGDSDAVNRQRIRLAIMNGDVDRALKLTNAFYPDVLKEKELLYFRLKRRKLVEMIRQVAETVHSDTNDAQGSDVVMQEATDGSNWDGMDVDRDSDGKTAHVVNALDAAVAYGQQLRKEFSSDTRPDIRKPLEEAMSLLAYTDPKSSLLSHLLDEDRRIADAEELNSAILVSLGKSSVAALERVIKQSTVMIQDLSEDGGLGAFVNIQNDYLKDPPLAF